MQTRLRGKVSASAFDPDLSCWLPEAAQLSVLDGVLQQYSMPILRNGVVCNPAPDTVRLMLVCRTWREYVQHHPCTCRRQVASTGLRVAWLTDAAHLACAEGQSRKAKLKRIPVSVKLLLSGGGRSSSSMDRCDGKAARGRGCGDASGSGGGDAHSKSTCSGCYSSGCGGGSESGGGSSDSNTTSAGESSGCRSGTGGRPGGSRWCQARVISSQLRSAFERSSFPARVPLLALDAAHLTPVELHWLAEVATSLDTTFLCPLVLRLTLSPVSPPPLGLAATGASGAALGPLGGVGAMLGGDAEASGGGGAAAALAGTTIVKITDGAAAASGSSAAAGAASAAAEVPRGLVLTRGGEGAVATGHRHECCTQAQARGQGGAEGAACASGSELCLTGVSSADVVALESSMLAVGSDGPHLYVVPTAAALQRCWPTS